MSKSLFTTLPSDGLGLLTRALPIATELAARGYEASFSDAVRDETGTAEVYENILILIGETA